MRAEGEQAQGPIEHGFQEGIRSGSRTVRRRHRGIYVGDNEATGWFGGGPSGYVLHEQGHQAEVVSIFRITPRDT